MNRKDAEQLPLEFFRRVWTPPHDLNAIDQLMTEDYQITSGGHHIKGRAAFKAWVAAFQTQLLDARTESQAVFSNAAGDRVVSRWLCSGRNNGMLGLPADGSPGNETMTLPLAKAVGHYKRSKILAEQRVLALCSQGLPVVVVHPSAPVGPWDMKPTPTGKVLVDFLRRKMPAYLDTGLNLIDVRDVAQGHILAAQRGTIGERYILGCRNMSLRTILQLLADVSGLPAPRWRIPYGVALMAGYVSEGMAYVTGKPPTVPLVGVRLARQPMYFTAHKAVRELGLPQSCIAEALRQAVQWFRQRGYA